MNGVTIPARTDDNQYGWIIGEIFVGAMSATQKDMYNKESGCYKTALIFEEELIKLLDKLDPGVIANRFNVAQIKLQSTFDACNWELLTSKIESRMSDLKFTLGIISNAASQTGAGFSS